MPSPKSIKNQRLAPAMLTARWHAVVLACAANALRPSRPAARPFVRGAATSAAEWRRTCDADGVASYYDAGVRFAGAEVVAAMPEATGGKPLSVAAWRALCDARGAVSFYDAGVRLGGAASTPAEAAPVEAPSAAAAEPDDATPDDPDDAIATALAGTAILGLGAAALGVDLEVATFAAGAAALVSLGDETSSISQLTRSVGRLGQSAVDASADVGRSRRRRGRDADSPAGRRRLLDSPHAG